MGRGGGASQRKGEGPSSSSSDTVVKVERDVSLARFTTVGIGGPAAAFARPTTVDELAQALEWAGEHELELRPIGLGSNVLAADTGVKALVVRLAGDLAGVTINGETVLAGGGAPNAVCLHRTRAAGLGGLEFACAIPGTAGGGVRMNAGAYGSDWSDVMTRALVVDSGGARWRDLAELELGYRHSALLPGDVVAQVEFRLEQSSTAEIRRTVADFQARRKATQPTNRRTFGSVFKNPEHELGAGSMLEACGLKGFRLGDAVISSRHANFIENAGSAHAEDAVGLMVEARRRAFQQFGVELEHEVELLGGLDLPAVE